MPESVTTRVTFADDDVSVPGPSITPTPAEAESEVFIQGMGRDQLSEENNGGFSWAWAVPGPVSGVSTGEVVLLENESPTVFALNAVAFGSAALTAGMNAVVTISTAIRRGKILSIPFVLIGSHLLTGRHNGQTPKYEEKPHVPPTGCRDVHPVVDGGMNITHVSVSSLNIGQFTGFRVISRPKDICTS